MALFEMTDRQLHRVTTTTFAAEQILERADLQAALRENISVLGDDLLVVSEEFGEFDVARRIDLLCVDRAARLVVVELKRTEDGGHMELQALRYAAMVWAMTFDQLVDTYRRHLLRMGSGDPDSARSTIAEWLSETDGLDQILDRQVRIILVSAGFDTQITTTVLWLNELFGLDITCVKLTPYRVDGRLLLDVQQVIPLPEAAEFTVRLRQREEAARAARTSNGADWTPYVILTPGGPTAPLRKRRAILAMVEALHHAGVPASQMAEVLPGHPRLLPVARTGAEVDPETFAAAYPKYANSTGRWFLDRPLTDSDGQSWVLSKMWGADTEDALDALLTLQPSDGFGYVARA